MLPNYLLLLPRRNFFDNLSARFRAVLRREILIYFPLTRPE